MSRWHVVSDNPALCVVELEHEDCGLWSRRVEAYETLRRMAPADLGEKATLRCFVCDYDAHLPGPSDLRRDFRRLWIHDDIRPRDERGRFR